jgi:Tol biopolymer transport system component
MRTTRDRAIFTLQSMALVFFLLSTAGCEDGITPPPPPPPVAAVSISPDTLSLPVGGQRALAATLKAASGQIISGRAITWASSDESVAKVSSGGQVTALSTGTARIRASSEGRADSATVTVLPVEEPVASVEIEPAGELSLDVGATLQLTAIAKAADGSELNDRTVAWTSSDEAVATVSAEGEVSALAEGTARIRAIFEEFSESVTVLVIERVASVEIEPSGPLSLVSAMTAQLTAITRSADGTVLTGRELSWSTDDSLVARITPAGRVTARATGRTLLTVTSEARSASIEVAVRQGYAFDLMYDSRTGYIPELGNEPEIYRLLIDPADADPVRAVERARVWDVAPSPDGTRIAFSCVHQHGPAICVMNTDRTGFAVLTPGPIHADQPAWSPDGARIAFRRWPQGATPGRFNPTRIWVMNADGSGQKNLTEDSGEDSWQETPTWSPRQSDGSYRIAYSHQTMSGEYVVGRIYSIRHDGGARRAETTGGEYLEREPAWSPDGSAIVFVRTGGTAFGDLWRVDAGGGNERQFMAVDPADDQRSPTWSPDGQYLAFTSKHEPSADNRWSYQIYTVRADGSGLTRRTHYGIDKENPAWIRR